jgi:PAS domain-containing protein
MGHAVVPPPGERIFSFAIPAERLADVLDIAEDGIVTVNEAKEIVLFNRGAAKIFG